MEGLTVSKKGNWPKPVIRLHLTNVAGAGATQLLQSLLPALERNNSATIADVYLPDRGEMASYRPASTSIRFERYRRQLPNAISRLFECTLLGHRFDGETPLLVLGDLPLRCNASQTVFVQTSHLLEPARFSLSTSSIKFAILRAIFRLNLRHAHAFIVQTPLMKDGLIATYPSLRGRVHVISQPAPTWLLETKLLRKKREALADTGGNRLRLIYPAACYPHKNHKLLANIASASASSWPVERLILTVDKALNPATEVPWLDCVGFLSAPEMIQAYRNVDGLLFLSTDESYGFPLVEAMFIGIPIVCPDLPYARALCLDGAIYFDPFSIDSLRNAIGTLHARLLTGWWPDWSAQLRAIPKDWGVVADAMLDVACSASLSPLSC